MILWFWYCVGNSSQVSDGAGAVLLMKRSVALQKGLPILGVFRYECGDFFLIFNITSKFTSCTVNCARYSKLLYSIF